MIRLWYVLVGEQSHLSGGDVEPLLLGLREVSTLVYREFRVVYERVGRVIVLVALL